MKLQQFCPKVSCLTEIGAHLVDRQVFEVQASTDRVSTEKFEWVGNMKKSMWVSLSGLVMLTAIGGCTMPDQTEDLLVKPAVLQQDTSTSQFFSTFPAPERPLDVAVYTFPDRTGKYEPGDNFATYSRAVSQGSASILVDVLKATGDGKWFEVAEREGIDSLLKERELIQRTRIAFQGPNAQPLPALRFAGVILEGGIVGYDSNEITGGSGAKYLGIGGDHKHRRDIITVTLRAVNVQSGTVMSSTTTTKTVYSMSLQGSVFKFVGINDLLEVEVGYTRNEPEQIAVREAIELAVHSMILEGSQKGLWKFSDPDEAKRAIEVYNKRYKSEVGELKVADTSIN